MKVKLVSVVALFVLLLGACSVPKDVVYFQGVDALTPEQVSKMNQAYTSKICPDDLLTITVTAWDPTVVTPFNPPVYAYATQGETTTVSSGQLRTYLVDQEGDINFPVLGKIHVAGLTKQQLSDKMQEMISPYVKDALVNVQIVNYKVTMMGEVSRPGAISVKNDRLSILDAIGQVGDLTINANRRTSWLYEIIMEKRSLLVWILPSRIYLLPPIIIFNKMMLFMWNRIMRRRETPVIVKPNNIV